jgi:hypothetical protein
MKKTIWIILVLAALVICVWFFLRPASRAPQQNVTPQTSLQRTNAAPVAIVSNTVPNTATATNAFIRPDSIDEATWNRILINRQVILSENQPIEFYARVLDQYGQPVGGARLKLRLGRMDETMFAPTNYLHWNPASAVQNKEFDLYSDANGWFQVTGTSGSFLEIWGLTKEGYNSSYPDGNFGGVHYELSGRTLLGEDIQMTNSWNPDVGYILHLQKIEETNSVNSAK